MDWNRRNGSHFFIEHIEGLGMHFRLIYPKG
jgi:hypothetical protein